MQDWNFMQNGGCLKYLCEHLYPIARADVNISPNCLIGRDAAFLSATRHLGLKGETITWENANLYCSESDWRSFPLPCDNAVEEQACEDGRDKAGAEIEVQDEDSDSVCDGLADFMEFSKAAAIIVQIPKAEDRDNLSYVADSWPWRESGWDADLYKQLGDNSVTSRQVPSAFSGYTIEPSHISLSYGCHAQ